MRFESKRDAWLVLTLRAVPIVVLLIVANAWYLTDHDLRGPLIGAVIVVVLELFFFDWVFRSTYYVIEAGTLAIHSSGITWRIPIRNITTIVPTRSPASSPALSLDRLRIDYDGKCILVSPIDKNAFVNALLSANPAIMRRA
jgi:PH (Pleckstrin Homology) domain-containing protein